MKTKQFFTSLAVALILPISQPLQALPTGAQVVHGSATFAQPNINTLNVTNSHNAIINWQQFNIGVGQTTNFIQPSVNSAVLNQVISNNPSQILGNLNSNGQVYLINQHGLLIGNNAAINTAGFFGSTLNITNEDFLNGNLSFSGGGLGDLDNQGYIHAGDNGNVVLIAPNINNGGVIEVDNGNIILAAGESITITNLNNASLGYVVQAEDNKVTNLGQIIANNGAAALFAGNLQHSGSIRASGLVVNADGSVSLTGDSVGGQIKLLADTIKITDGAIVDASGNLGGGEILIGGDQQGLNPEIKNATSVTIAQGADVSADAIESGDGGRVIVFAENDVHVHGVVSATGGAISGDGGFIETSGLQVLDITNLPDTTAQNGLGGEWLIDPNNITIVSGTGSNITGNPDFTTTDDSALLDAGLIEAALNAGTSVTISTGTAGSNSEVGNITIMAPITKSVFSATVSLTMNAHNDINVDAPIISNNGQLMVLLNADIDGDSAGVINLGADINPSFGDINLNGDIFVNADVSFLPMGDLTIGAGDTLTITNGNSLALGNNSINTNNISGGQIIINGTLISDSSCGDGCGSNNYLSQITNNGVFEVVEGEIFINGIFENNGTLTVSNVFDTTALYIGSTGDLRLNAGSAFSGISNGQFIVNSGGLLNALSPSAFQSDLILTLNQGTIDNAQNLIIPDQFNVFGGSITGTGDFVIPATSTASFNSSNIATISMNTNLLGAMELLPTSTVSIPSGLDLSQSTGLLIGDGGTLDGNVTVNGGTIVALTTLSINGDLTMNSGSMMAVLGVEDFGSGPTELTPSVFASGTTNIFGGNLLFLWDSAQSAANAVDNLSFSFLSCSTCGQMNFDGIVVDPIRVTGSSLTADSSGLTYNIDTVDPTANSIMLWSGGAGTNIWEDGGNWVLVTPGGGQQIGLGMTGAVPGATDYVFIESLLDINRVKFSPAVTLTTGQTIAGLQSSGILDIGAGGHLQLNGNAVIYNDLQINANQLTLSGIDASIDNVSVGVPAALILAPGSNSALNQGVLNISTNNLGAMQWAGNTSLSINDILTNYGLFEISHTAPAVLSTDGTGIFINLGDIKVNSTSIVDFNLALISNAGLIDVSTGTILNMGSGGSTILSNSIWNNQGTVNFVGNQLSLTDSTFNNLGELTVDDQSSIILSSGSTLTNVAGSQITGAGTLNVGPGSTLISAGEQDSTVLDVAALNLIGGTFLTDGVKLNQNFNWFSGLVLGTSLTTAGETILTSGILDSATWINEGNVTWVADLDQTLVLNNFAEITNTGNFTIEIPVGSGGITAFSNSDLVSKILIPSSNGTFINQGSLVIDAGNEIVDFASDFQNDGGIIFIKSGTFSLSGEDLVLNQNSVLTGNGSFMGNVNNVAGQVSPGVVNPLNSSFIPQTGTLTIIGNYFQGPNGTLGIKLDGVVIGDNLFDVLNVTGDFNAGGTLKFELINNQSPLQIASLIGNEFTPIIFEVFNQSFDDVQVPTGLDLRFENGVVTISSNSVILNQLAGELDRLINNETLTKAEFLEELQALDKLVKFSIRDKFTEDEDNGNGSKLVCR